MNASFERKYFLRTSDFDCRGHITPASVLDLFQDVAGAHASLLGCGFDHLIKKDILWVLVRVRYTVEREPARSSAVILKTWPLAPSRAGCKREYLILDEAGNTLIKGSSDWVMMHAVRRRLVPAKEVYPEGLCHITEQNFPDGISKLHDFEAADEGAVTVPGFSQLDMNGHVNNTKYANFVLDASPAEGLIHSFQIDYKREVLKGTPLHIHTRRDGGITHSKGCDDNGNLMFICSFEE